MEICDVQACDYCQYVSWKNNKETVVLSERKSKLQPLFLSNDQGNATLKLPRRMHSRNLAAADIIQASSHLEHDSILLSEASANSVDPFSSIAQLQRPTCR